MPELPRALPGPPFLSFVPLRGPLGGPQGHPRRYSANRPAVQRQGPRISTARPCGTRRRLQSFGASSCIPSMARRVGEGSRATASGARGPCGPQGPAHTEQSRLTPGLTPQAWTFFPSSVHSPQTPCPASGSFTPWGQGSTSQSTSAVSVPSAGHGQPP